MTTHDATNRRSRPGRVDFTLMYAAHDAFQRDLQRLTVALESGRATESATRAGWATFHNQLHVHHTVEDIALWPPLRRKLERADETAVLDSMEAEHARIDPLLAQVDAAFAASDGWALAEAAGELSAALADHMRHEEEAALPLVDRYLGPEGWDEFRAAIRKRQGLKGGAEFVPWILDSAPADIRKRVLGTLPPPARVLYRAVWRRGYARTPRWSTAPSLT